ncbi:transcriptional regulator, PadR family [Lachnospiraceae bacterium KM106-2]|nr:transcriptional regulator, PadR family [Lachnospiraceae bacterium KM106-2]
MNLSKYLPLTETTYYILIALMEPGHGYYVMQKVEELSDGKVRIAAGTMYGAIDNLVKQKMIASVPSEDKRRKVYQITEQGLEVLKLEVSRLNQLVNVARTRGLEEGMSC